ncbi:hypothetical protein PFICI_03232 [Pestalotiopsis fici W106-1]|uniref:Transcription factor domain-containing protein n=1 Tax=Pestalotiopsis fici (strain W106-1 / CGMCC3.15140) TaxID=1229662 RepID=W3XIE1_PESFW|nr:uncharacterized protein PFICI_03232 [Pestalotiopsis fici W106-1]ETS85207.1 hypothetical protein PFICI_03232 [Pestalotiopsis fici W106-1]
MSSPHDQSPGREILDYIDPTLLLPCDSEVWLGALQDTEEQDLLGHFVLPAGQGLEARLELLESHVAAHARTTHLPRDLFDSRHFGNFFSPFNVNTFARIFCRKRHYQHTVIHWPTFSLEKAALPLLMVVALTGATYSFHSRNGPGHITAARSFYRLADSYVFHELRKCVQGGASTSNIAESIELCQAALLMYALDTLLAGDEGVQCAAMTERLPALISTMRKLRFVGCRHDPSEDWSLFLQREQIIRLVSWAYGADCLITMSFNTPPFFSLLEMTGDLPCDPLIWDSDPSALESLRPFQDTTSYCIKGLMSWLLDDNMQSNDILERVPLFHLHIMLCAIQPIIFNLHISLSLPSQSDRLLRALATWRHLWGNAIDKLPDDQRKWLGVAKHVPDIEYLSRRIIEVSISSHADSSQYLKRVPSHTAREVHEFIREFVSRT